MAAGVAGHSAIYPAGFVVVAAVQNLGKWLRVDGGVEGGRLMYC